MPSLFAPLTLLASASLASAAPFQLERLVIQGESLPGLSGLVAEGSIRVPSINSHGQWAVAVGTLNTQGPGFISGVLGNDGFRIPPGFDPDGSASPVGTFYEGVNIADSGRLAAAVPRFGTPAQIWLDDQLVANSPGANFRDVTILPGDVLVSTVRTSVATFWLASEPTGSGSWTTAVVHGHDAPTPVGQVLGAPSHAMGYARSASGRQAWAGSFLTGGDNNPDEITRGIVVDDAFLVVDGQPSQLPGFEYRTDGGNGVHWNSKGDLFFGAGLESTGDGPAQAVGGIFSEDGGLLVSTLDDYEGLEEFNGWSVSGTNFDVDDHGNVLWVAQSFEFPGPDHPFPFFRTALMYNDTLIVKMGDVLDDGLIVVGARAGFALSDDGSWAIATLSVYDAESNLFLDSVYRFQIPAPATVLIGLGASFYGMSRRRR